MSSLPEPDHLSSLSLEKQESKVRLWAEVGVVLALAVLPNLFHAISFFWIPKGAAPPFVVTAFSYFFQAVQESLPVLYIMYLTGKPWGFFGLQRPQFLLDSMWGALIFVALFLAMACLDRVLPREDPTRPQIAFPDVRERGLLLILLTSFSIGFAEELISRAYLIPRLEQLLGKTWESILVSTALFASYHCYKGVLGMVTSFASGLVFAVAFCLLRRVWPLVLAHGMWDLVGFLRE